MLYHEDNTRQIEAEQVSLIFGPNWVITFQERERDVFNTVRERIKKGKGRLRKMGADYLAYALVDAIVDHYFIILEEFGEEIEDTETELATNPTRETLQTIRTMKKEMVFLRKPVWPLRELVSSLERGGSQLIRESTWIYLRDVYDHTIQVIDTVESFRDMISAMLDIYLSSISSRMNEVMKVLTIFAAIFIPLTFVAGIYGMNFEYMPELKWHWGYFVCNRLRMRSLLKTHWGDPGLSFLFLVATPPKLRAGNNASTFEKLTSRYPISPSLNQLMPPYHQPTDKTHVYRVSLAATRPP
jgi:magnesium transporter